MCATRVVIENIVVVVVYSMSNLTWTMKGHTFRAEINEVQDKLKRDQYETNN